MFWTFPGFHYSHGTHIIIRVGDSCFTRIFKTYFLFCEKKSPKFWSIFSKRCLIYKKYESERSKLFNVRRESSEYWIWCFQCLTPSLAPCPRPCGSVSVYILFWNKNATSKWDKVLNKSQHKFLLSVLNFG